MIIIEKITKTYNSMFSKLICDISINGKSKQLYIETYSRWGNYLNEESGDPFLIALIPTAIFGKHDVLCKVPISEDLIYGISSRLIPILSHFSEKVYRSDIKCTEYYNNNFLNSRTFVI